MTLGNKNFGFTLAELLIALAILGAIATFTIPKILVAQQDSKNNAIAKEAASAMSEAFQKHQLSGLVTTGTRVTHLTQYLNYVGVDTVSTIDNVQTAGSVPCAGSHPCIRLASGAVIRCSTGTFVGTETTNAISFLVDPDGSYSGTTDGPGKGITFFLYYNGRLATYGTLAAGSSYNGTPYTATPAYDPPWFSW